MGTCARLEVGTLKDPPISKMDDNQVLRSVIVIHLRLAFKKYFNRVRRRRLLEPVVLAR